MTESEFPNRFPEERRSRRKAVAVLLTLLFAVAALTVLLVCISVNNGFRWGGFVLLGLVFAYSVDVLPLWFKKPNMVVFVPAWHAAAAGYLLFICSMTKGNWFMAFAFPVTGINAVVFTALVALLRYTKGGRYYLFGGFSILLGIESILLEMFAHMAFSAGMFVWSQYSACALVLYGIFLILVGLIPPLREHMKKLFYI